MLILRPEETRGLITMAEAVEATEIAVRDWGSSHALNAPRRRTHVPSGVRVVSTRAVFKNNAGQGIADVAIAARVYQRAREQGLGLELPLGTWSRHEARGAGCRFSAAPTASFTARS